jgi:late competence protein required for DNA uptake (superfamily II DNA/RNA helicase)
MPVFTSSTSVQAVHPLDVLAIDLADTDSAVRATLTADIRYLVTFDDGSVVTVTVPTGFQTDLASIPRFLWSMPGFSPLDRNGLPAVLHDFLYSTTSTAEYPVFVRSQADECLRAALEDEGENVVVREMIYLAVREFGAGHWKKTV